MGSANEVDKWDMGERTQISTPGNIIAKEVVGKKKTLGSNWRTTHSIAVRKYGQGKRGKERNFLPPLCPKCDGSRMIVNIRVGNP